MSQPVSLFHFFLKIILNTALVLVSVILLINNYSLIQRIWDVNPYIISAVFLSPGILIIIWRLVKNGKRH